MKGTISIIGCRRNDRGRSLSLIPRMIRGRKIMGAGRATFGPHTIAHEGEDHRHAYDELFWVLSGNIAVPGCGKGNGKAGPGEFIVVPAGQEHHLTNRTDRSCTVLWMLLGRKR